eukprot:1982350-Prymnesium_polylepis.1
MRALAAPDCDACRLRVRVEARVAPGAPGRARRRRVRGPIRWRRRGEDETELHCCSSDRNQRTRPPTPPAGPLPFAPCVVSTGKSGCGAVPGGAAGLG